jgi:hypothetical protein
MARPQANNGKLRELVREVLCIAPGYALEDEALCDAVRELLPMHTANNSEILAAAEWNLGKGYAVAGINEDTDNRDWRITKDGIAKNNL